MPHFPHALHYGPHLPHAIGVQPVAHRRLCRCRAEHQDDGQHSHSGAQELRRTHASKHAQVSARLTLPRLPCSAISMAVVGRAGPWLGHGLLRARQHVCTAKWTWAVYMSWGYGYVCIELRCTTRRQISIRLLGPAYLQSHAVPTIDSKSSNELGGCCNCMRPKVSWPYKAKVHGGGAAAEPSEGEVEYKAKVHGGGTTAEPSEGKDEGHVAVRWTLPHVGTSIIACHTSVAARATQGQTR